MKPANLILAAALLLASAVAPAQARMWSKDPAALAQDYLLIQDRRANGEVVLVFWLASPLIPPSTPNGGPARELLDKYTLVGTAHVKMSALQAVTAVVEEPAVVEDSGGHALAAVKETAFPPAMVGTLAVLKSLFAKALGPFGTAVQWSVYEAPPVKPCEKGGIHVNYAGTAYTYDTPIPGCP